MFTDAGVKQSVASAAFIETFGSALVASCFEGPNALPLSRERRYLSFQNTQLAAVGFIARLGLTRAHHHGKSSSEPSGNRSGQELTKNVVTENLHCDGTRRTGHRKTKQWINE